MIEHPFINDANDKTTEELLEIINGLNKKLMMANKMNNPAMFNQLLMAINTYRSALQIKQQEQYASNSGEITGQIDIQ